MTQAATFGRRGTVAVPPPGRSSQPPPTARASTPTTAAPRAAAKAESKPAGDSLLSYFLWLLFSFDHRLDRRTYRYARIVANLGYVFIAWNLNAQLLKSSGDPLLQLSLALFSLGLSGVMIWTTLAMQVKRRHDRDKGWAWLFVGFIPIIGPIWVLVETCWLDGTAGYNRFDDPSKVAAAVF
jgi:uncharacterized membrane protein YhaH (DUF805 family)